MKLLADITYRVLEALDRPAKAPTEERPHGIAMIIALVTIAILSAAVVEYAYSSRVNLTMSVNSADKLRSYYLSRSGVELARLLLNFQYSLQSEADTARGKENLAGAGSCNPRMISIAMRRSNFQMHQYMDLLMRPFNSGALETPVGGIDLSDAGVEGFGNFAGNFDVNIEPESGKFNINQFARRKAEQSDVQDLCALTQDSEYTRLFRRDDEDGQVLDRYRMLQYVVDYIDLNETELPLTEQCTLEKGSGSGDEGAQYSDSDTKIEPRNAMLTHVEELYQVYGISEEFMQAFKDQLTVYPVGKPNANIAKFPIFYSILCRNVQLGKQGEGGTPESQRGLTPCQASPQIQMQVMFFAMALDGVRKFFEDPLSVLMAYVGSTESRLLPSAKKGQPIAFLRTSQVHSYLQDFKRNPKLLARFMTFSPTYQRIVALVPKMRLDPNNPQLPQFNISFNRGGILRSLTTRTPSIYRIKSTGTYGATQTTVETVIDFGKPVRRLPNEKKLEKQEQDSEQLKKLKDALREREKTMPKGRVLYWRENVIEPVEEGDGSGQSGVLPQGEGGFGDEGTEPGGGEGTESGGEDIESGGEGTSGAEGESAQEGGSIFGGGEGQSGKNWNFNFGDD